MEWIDGVSVAIRALAFVAALQAAGLALFVRLVGSFVPDWIAPLNRLIRTTGLTAAVLVVLHRLLDGGRMAGDWSGIIDPQLQAMLWSRRPGLSTAVCTAGLVVLAATAVSRGAWAAFLASLGIVGVIGSFALTGHTTQANHGGALRALLTLHVAIAAFWIGAVAGLYRMALRAPVADGVQPTDRTRATLLADAAGRFSAVAVWIVPLILPAGLLMIWGLLPDWRALRTPYGGLLLLKFIGFCTLMAFAAANHLRLVPGLSEGSAASIRALRLSLVLEYGVLVMVLAITAVMTALFSWH